MVILQVECTQIALVYVFKVKYYLVGGQYNYHEIQNGVNYF